MSDDEDGATSRVRRAQWVVMMIAIALEFGAGLIGMLYVPFNRASGWLSHRGEVIYVVHALLGAVLDWRRSHSRRTCCERVPIG